MHALQQAAPHAPASALEDAARDLAVHSPRSPLVRDALVSLETGDHWAARRRLALAARVARRQGVDRAVLQALQRLLLLLAFA